MNNQKYVPVCISDFLKKELKLWLKFNSQVKERK